MNLQNIILAAFAAGALSLGGAAQAQTINPMTAAVIEAYGKILKENPKDYFTLYQRAAQYYRLSDYDKALDDITKAIEYTPVKEKDMLLPELSLAADILIQTQDYTNALIMADRGLAIAPDDYPLLYKRGNICLYLKDYTGAKKSFETLRRNEPRSQEAYFGLAQVAAAEGDKENLDKLLKEAENCNPSSYVTYCRLGDIYSAAGEYSAAANAYLSAFGLAEDTSRPVQSLVALGQENYNAVANALRYVIDKSSTKEPLYLILGNIAYGNGRYDDALGAFTALSTLPEGKEASVFNNLARTTLAMNRTDVAADYAESALRMGPTAATYILKSEIELTRNNIEGALAAAGKAKAMAPDAPDAIMASAVAKIVSQDWEGALTELNNAAMADPSDPRPLMLRAYIHSNGVKNTRAATFDLQRVATLPATSFPEALYKGLAQTILGKRLDGNNTIENALRNDSTPEAFILAAIYYANTGAADKALSFRDKGVAAGYANRHVLDSQIMPGMDLSPIRK